MKLTPAEVEWLDYLVDRGDFANRSQVLVEGLKVMFLNYPPPWELAAEMRLQRQKMGKARQRKSAN